MPALVTVFLTTPRSGTQWVTEVFAQAYPDLAVVKHEPLRYEYRPREFIRAYDRIGELARIESVKDHIEEIAALEEDRVYIEVGFPCAAAIPLFYEVFPEKLRVVQLIRHPVRVGASLVGQGMYQPSRPDLTEAVALTPWEPGIFQSHYEARWDALSVFEKCLFYWSEVHLYGLELGWRYPELPIHRVRFVDLIEDSGATLPALAEFMGLPYRPEIEARTGDRVDRFARPTGLKFDAKTVRNHALVVALAEHFGYDLDADLDQIARPYFSWRTFARSASRRLRQRFDTSRT